MPPPRRGTGNTFPRCLAPFLTARCRARFLSLAVMPWLLAGTAQADSFPSWYAKAQKAEARHDDEDALQAWSNALHLWKSTDSKPKKARALAARAALYEKKGEWEAALEDLSGALKLATKDAVLFRRRGVVYLEHGQTSEAISDFYKATALKPDYSEAFFDRGRAYAAQGDAEFSKEDLRTACHLGFQKACTKAAPAKGSAKSKGPGRSAAPPPAVQTSSTTAATIPRATGHPLRADASPDGTQGVGPSVPAQDGGVAAPPAAGSSTNTAATEITVGSTLEELPIGKMADGEEALQKAPPDFRFCINRIRSCADNGDSYSTCVSRARLCEKYPKQGCCPHDCVVLFQKLLNSKSEAAAFRQVFAPKSACLPIKTPKPAEILEDAAP